MSKIPHMGGLSIESDVETENICNDFLKNYSLLKKENVKLSLKVKNLEKEKTRLSINIENFKNSVDFLKIENSELSLKNENFEKEICFLKQNLSESVEKFESQRADFMEKLKISQCKFLDCEKLRKNLELKNKELTSELEKYKDISTKFTNGSQGLDKLLGIGKNFGDRKGLGFDKSKNVASTSKTTFVKSTNNFEKSQDSQGKMTSKSLKFQNPRSNRVEINRNNLTSSHVLNKKFIPICHHCGVVGHIRPKCLKLLNDTSSSKTNFEKSKMFVKKSPISNKNLNSKGINFSKSKSCTFDNNRNKSNRYSTSNNKFVPTCNHCACFGLVRPNCYKLYDKNASVKMNLVDKVDMLMCEIERLRKPRNKRLCLDLSDTKRMASNTMWVRKDRFDFNTIPISKFHDFSNVKILKRGDEFKNF